MSFKLVLIGCGAIAHKGHGPALRFYADNHVDVELAACVDRDIVKAEAFAAAFGFGRAYADIGEALDAEQPAAVSLVVPAPLIAGLAEPILRKGYPLLLEKPPGLSMAEALRIRDASLREGAEPVPHQVAFNRRYMPVSRQVRELSAKWIQERRLHHISYDIHRVGRTDAEDASVTVIHGIDVLRQWAGSDYRTATFRYGRLPQLGADVANVSVTGEFMSGVTFQLNYFPVSGAVHERAVLTAEDATLHVRLPFWTSPDLQGGVELYTGNKLVRHWSGTELVRHWDGSGLAGGESWAANGFYAENAAFLDDIRTGRRPAGDTGSALQAVAVAECLLLRKEEYRTQTDAAAGGASL